MAITSISVLATVDNVPVVVDIPLEEPTVLLSPKPPKAKKEIVPQKGNNVAPGHEGSRRRRRYEMQHLLGCPQRVEPSAEDWTIAPIRQHRTIRWDCAAGVDSTNLSIAPRSKPHTAKDLNRLPRALRQELKRTHVSPAFVHGIEKEMRDMIDPATAEPDYDVVEADEAAVLESKTASPASIPPAKRSIHISVEAPTDKARSYSRWWVHLISKYYNLKSYSKDVGTQRIACIDVQGKQLPAVWFCDLL